MLVKDVDPRFIGRLLLRTKNCTSQDGRNLLNSVINNKILNDVNDISNNRVDALLEEYSIQTTEDFYVKKQIAMDEFAEIFQSFELKKIVSDVEYEK